MQALLTDTAPESTMSDTVGRVVPIRSEVEAPKDVDF
jgi:hypothetical protein